MAARKSTNNSQAKKTSEPVKVELVTDKYENTALTLQDHLKIQRQRNLELKAQRLSMQNELEEETRDYVEARKQLAQLQEIQELMEENQSLEESIDSLVDAKECTRHDISSASINLEALRKKLSS